MRNLYCILLGIVLFSCNPYEGYNYTHYYIQAELIPDSAYFSANVQMVFVARKEYHDSICFDLNPAVKIHSLASQELEHYLFSEYQAGKLVLYIEDAVQLNDQLHISLSYSGRLHEQGITSLDSSYAWYPHNEETQPFTYQAKFALPGNWQISHPETGTGQHGKWLLESPEPLQSLKIKFTLSQL
ncbi:hypothetical protein ACFLSP_00095 [Bacteroidota bacterium]